MRKIKIITTQDHWIVLNEVQNENQEVTCIDAETGIRGMYPTESTAFTAEGSVTSFLKDGSDNWEYTINEVAPEFTFLEGGAELGCVSTSSFFRSIGIYPKDSIVVNQWKPFIGINDDQITAILDPTMRESFVEICSFTMNREMDSDTFEELALSSLVSDSEIVYL